MPAYIIADVDWIVPERIEEYSQLAYPTLVAAGGKMLAATSQGEVIEGEGSKSAMAEGESSSPPAQNQVIVRKIVPPIGESHV